MNYTSLTGPSGQDDNMGGLTQRAYFARISDFLVIATPDLNTTLADTVTINDDHTFNATKCFKKIYCTMDKGKVDLKGQGDNDGKSFKQEGEIFYPGSLAEAHGFAAQAKNDNFVFLMEHPDSAENGFLQIGTEMFPAKINPEFTTATNSGGVKGYTFKIEAMTPRQYVYVGAVTLTPAS